MKQVAVNENMFKLLAIHIQKEKFRGNNRRVCALTLEEANYNKIKETFKDGINWKIKDGSEEYDWSDFNLSGQITDMRDGTFIVKMGERYSEQEILQNDINELKENISIITGDMEPSVENLRDVKSKIEELYLAAPLSNDELISYRIFAPLWKKGNHKKDEIYATVLGVNTSVAELEQVWKCFQDYNNEVYPDISPGNPSWRVFNIPLHGISIETAMPWTKPTNATDQYKSGEYMLYTDGFIYKCLQDTNFSPEEYGGAWEKQLNN